jgi:hypothetical protein
MNTAIQLSKVRVIGVMPGELLTTARFVPPRKEDGSMLRHHRLEVVPLSILEELPALGRCRLSGDGAPRGENTKPLPKGVVS